MILKFIRQRTGILLLGASLLVGLFTFGSYGVSMDECAMRSIGQVSYNYLFTGDTALKTFSDADYGVAFELPLVMIEHALKLSDSRSIYLMRHLVTHLFFLLSAYFLFLLINYLYRNKLLVAIGFLLLLLNPLIYTHSFFNSKDVPFMSMLIICFLVAAVAFNKHTFWWYLLLGVACGLLTDIRIMGILMISAVCFFFLLDFIFAAKDKKERRKIVYFFMTFFLSALIALYAAWPYLYTKSFLKLCYRLSRHVKVSLG